MIRYPLLSFNSGELSPQVDARSDVDKYRAGCRMLENMIPRIYGTAERRPGTKYIDTCDGVARVIPFIYSDEIAYIVLMEDLRFWFYYDGGRVLDSEGRRLGIDTPYSADDLFVIQYKQSNDVMWLVHEDYQPRKLSRTTANSFSLDPIVFNNGPFQKRHDLEYDDGMTMTPSATLSVATDDVSDEAIAYIASSTHNSTLGAAKAFDDRTTGAGCYWQAGYLDFADEYVGCQFSSGKTIQQVRIAPFVARPPIDYLPDWFYNPRHIRIDASNDGSTWTKIPINGWTGNCQVYQTNEAELGQVTSTGAWCQMTLDNSTAYTYWRVYVHDIWGADGTGIIPLMWWLYRALRINEIEFIESTTTWGDNVTLTASAPFFDALHVGALFSLTQERAETSLSGSMTAPTTGTTDDILVEGSFTFTTHGIWTGKISLERSIDRSQWETYRTWTSDTDVNVQYTGSEEEANVYYRINVLELTANTAPGTTDTSSKVSYDLTVNSSTQTGICRVTGYTSSTVVSVEVLKPFASTDPTERWAEGCWSDYRGWPRTMTFFGERAWYAGTRHQPQTVWGSAVDDFENFDECNKDDSAFSLTLSSDTRNGIKWIAALEALIVGTTGGEWRIRSSGLDEPLTPSNYNLRKQTTYGSAPIQAHPVNDCILMVDDVRRKVREITYNGDKDKYVAPDLTALAEHITESGIVEMDYQRNPDPILWAVRTDGTLLSMTYEREQNVVAWARHPFETGDITVDAVPGEEGTPSTYKYTYFSEPGSIWGIPLEDGDSLTLDAAAVVDNGDGTITIPCTGHQFVAGEKVRFCGTSHYDGNAYTLAAGTTTDVLVITHVYSAETFDGTETVLKAITGLGGGFGGSTCGTDGSLYYVHDYDGTSALTKIDADGTQHEDAVSYTTIPVGGQNGVGVELSVDEQSIYLNMENLVAKYDLATGAELWCNESVNGSYAFARDASDNVYAPGYAYVAGVGWDSNVKKLDATTGEHTNLTLMGHNKGPQIVVSTYECIVDDTLGIVIAGGNQGSPQFWGQSSYLYNLSVRTFDDSAGDQVAVGGTYVIPGAIPADSTHIISRGYLASNGEHIFVLCQGPNWTIWKYAWDGTSLSLVDSTAVPDASLNYVDGIDIDAYGNIILSYHNGTARRFYFYDTDLNLLSQTQDYPAIVLQYWRPVVAGSAYIQGNMTLYGEEGTPGTPGTEAYTISGTGCNSVAVIPSDTEDEVWLVVAFAIGGELVRHLVQMQPRAVDDQEDMWFSDSALDYDGPPTITFTGLDHLEGEEVVVLGDGAVFSRQTVSDGEITLDGPVARAIVGLPFRYKLKPMRFDLSVALTTKGTLKVFQELVISLYRSGNVWFGVDTDNLFNIDFRTEEAYGSPPDLYTGDKVLSCEGGFNVEDPIIITSDDPLPCTVRAMVPRIELTGR